MKIKVRSRNGGLEEAVAKCDAPTKATDLAEYCCARLLKKKVLDELELDLVFDLKLHKKYGTIGLSIFTDDHVKPRKFLVEIDAAESLGCMLNTVAHEMVHVSQWATGRLKHLHRTKEQFTFCGRRVATDDVDYWELPWEIEAYGRQPGLVRNWVNDRGLSEERWAPGLFQP